MTDSVKRLYDRSLLQVSTGTTSLVMTSADFTTYQPVVTLAPDGNHATYDTKVCIDLAKASTGFAAGYTSGTITFAIQRKVDGTNWRSAANKATTALSGTLSAASMIELDLGVVSPTEGARIVCKVSAEGADFDLPYVVTYRAGAKAALS